MPDLKAFFRSAPVSRFAGVAYRLCPAIYRDHLVSMRGAFLHGARYNIRGYFGALYVSLSRETARREVERYFTVPPLGGFVEASIGLRLVRVVDLTNRAIIRTAGILSKELSGQSYTFTREIGLRAWENGIEALLLPSAANPDGRNLAVFLDNQHPVWSVELTRVAAL